MYLCNPFQTPMKHIFIINPGAGKQNATQQILQMVNSVKIEFNHETYLTKGERDATRFVKEYLTDHPSEEVRFYACGGDGTINEVASGIVGFPNAQMTCIPVGSGNDYVKYYGSPEEFLNLENLIDGIPHPIDIMKIGERYSINVTNCGFDAEVCIVQDKVRRYKLIGGKNAYTTGIVKCLFTSLRNQCNILLDGQPFHNAPMLLCTFSNGQFMGGKYNNAPLSRNDDGLIDVCLIKPVNIIQLALLIGAYAKGTHLKEKRFRKLLAYKQAKTVELSNPKPFWLCIDGEMIQGNHFKIEILPKAITFVSPRH